MSEVLHAVFSLSERSAEGEDAAYLAWHQLDHLPEQFRLPGLRWGQRWVSSPACRAARAASSERYDSVDHIVHYLFVEPAVAVLPAFFELGNVLGKHGRMPHRLLRVEVGGFELVATSAAPRVKISADVLPWRPNRGAYVLMEPESKDELDDLTSVPGVAGTWTYRGTRDVHPRLLPTDGLRLTVCYLDGDPVTVAESLRPLLERRWDRTGIEALLAAPFEVAVPWQWAHLVPSP